VLDHFTITKPVPTIAAKSGKTLASNGAGAGRGAPAGAP